MTHVTTNLCDNLWKLEEWEPQYVEQAECCEGLGCCQGLLDEEQVGDEGEDRGDGGDGDHKHPHEGLL